CAAWKPPGALIPPLYSGIVPSLLPAFSAPTGVSVVPSCLASSAGTAASAPVLKIAAKPAASNVMRNIVVSPRIGNSDQNVVLNVSDTQPRSDSAAFAPLGTPMTPPAGVKPVGAVEKSP